jgi:hypothetical protein
VTDPLLSAGFRPEVPDQGVSRFADRRSPAHVPTLPRTEIRGTAKGPGYAHASGPHTPVWTQTSGAQWPTVGGMLNWLSAGLLSVYPAGNPVIVMPGPVQVSQVARVGFTVIWTEADCPGARSVRRVQSASTSTLREGPNTCPGLMPVHSSDGLMVPTVMVDIVVPGT